MEDKTIIKKAVSSYVNIHFEDIKERLLKTLKFHKVNEQSIALLNNTKLIFTNLDRNNFQACAIYDYLEFEDREQSHLINWELARANSYAKTIIHEIAHLIISDYPRILINNNNAHHCLEFAIVTYCIEHKLYKKNDRDSCYFNSYDIHEDKAFEIIAVNSSQFDCFIKSIQWTTFDDLVNQAEQLATKIRKISVTRKGF